MGDATEAFKRSLAQKAKCFEPLERKTYRARAPLRQETRTLTPCPAPRPQAKVTPITLPRNQNHACVLRKPELPRPKSLQSDSAKAETPGLIAGDPSGFFLEESPLVPIPTDRSGFWQPRAVALEEPGPIAEIYRHLALRVTRDLEIRGGNSLLVTSSVPGEGKTTTACNLALALASISADSRVALVDFDLRKPRIAECMGATATGGVEYVLHGRCPLSSVRARTNHPSLDLFLSGPCESGVHELIFGPRLRRLIKELSRHYQHVIIDSPPAIPFPDAAKILGAAEACLTVVRAGETRRAAFDEMLEILPSSKVIGTFVNHSRGARHATTTYR